MIKTIGHVFLDSWNTKNSQKRGNESKKIRISFYGLITLIEKYHNCMIHLRDKTCRV